MICYSSIKDSYLGQYNCNYIKYSLCSGDRREHVIIALYIITFLLTLPISLCRRLVRNFLYVNMTTLFDTRFYYITKLTCSMAGLWPYQSWFRKKILLSFNFIVLLSYLPPQVSIVCIPFY